jgi:hypothetical protein
MTVSGSNHGTAKDQQYALKKFYDNHWLPEMDEKKRERWQASEG